MQVNCRKIEKNAKMNLTPLEFVMKEFPDMDQELSTDVWLRKMQEFAVLQNSKIDISRLLELEYTAKAGLISAISALYFSDSKEYKNALFQVVHHISGISYDDLNEETINAIYFLFAPQ
jgi:hypothetical protein